MNNQYKNMMCLFFIVLYGLQFIYAADSRFQFTDVALSEALT